MAHSSTWNPIMTQDVDLTGFRVLVVEDEMLVAMLVEDMLSDLGCIIVGPASNLEDAKTLAREAEIDGAVLDVNLAGKPVFPVADILKERGVPHVFASGYGESGIEPAYRGGPVLQKPFRDSDLADAVRSLKTP